MSADWQVGDLALCVNDSPCAIYGPVPYVKGRIYTVASVRFGTDKTTGVQGEGLKMAEIKARYWRRSDCFRKIRPDEHQACEPEFITLLKRTKRTVKA
jgi:hypothetical protein